jgi:tetratricopeptide (TPR) repeat protein
MGDKDHRLKRRNSAHAVRASLNPVMTLETDDVSSIKRRLVLRDALTFVGLLTITIVLFGVTLFLFRSFAAHRAELAQRWSDRGRSALKAGHPDQATVAMRTALSYAPEERSYELLLAQALGEAGHLDESYNYFLGLWETEPGDGFINLSLARLAAKKNDIQGAINYYRASIYGTWEGDGIERRREIRLELARYLNAHHDVGGARAELLVAGGNNSGDMGLMLTLAALLEQTGDTQDALSYYEKVLAAQPDNQTALTAAGRLEYEDGRFEEAHRLLERAANEQERSGSGTPHDAAALLENSAAILALSPSKKLPPMERVTRILKARDIAKKRLDSCNAKISATRETTSPLQNLNSRWMERQATAGRAALLKDALEQDANVKLIFDTEMQTSQICGAPVGDDALLLLLAHAPKAMEP